LPGNIGGPEFSGTEGRGKERPWMTVEFSSKCAETQSNLKAACKQQ